MDNQSERAAQETEIQRDRASGVCLTSLLYLTSSNAAGPEEGPEEADKLRHDTQKEMRETFTEREGASGRQTHKRDAHKLRHKRQQETRQAYRRKKNMKRKKKHFEIIG